MIVQCQLDLRSGNVNVIAPKKKQGKTHTVQFKAGEKMASKKHIEEEKRIKPNDILQY